MSDNNTYASYAGPRIDSVRVIGSSGLRTEGGTKVNTGGNFGPRALSECMHIQKFETFGVSGLGATTFNATDCEVTVASVEIIAYFGPGNRVNQS